MTPELHLLKRAPPFKPSGHELHARALPHSSAPRPGSSSTPAAEPLMCGAKCGAALPQLAAFCSVFLRAPPLTG
eukprot:1220796-Alexandrium_andersonii.AAC.1